MSASHRRFSQHLHLIAACAMAACGGGGDDPGDTHQAAIDVTTRSSGQSPGAAQIDTTSAHLSAPLMESVVPTDHGDGAFDTHRFLPSPRPMSIAAASPTAHLSGSFDAPVAWPMIPIHVLLLPDGRLMSYGTNPAGTEAYTPNYDIWDPVQGFGAASHLVLPNQTNTNIFCTAQVLVPGTGRGLLAGGDRAIGGVGNFGIDSVSLFDPTSNSLTKSSASMATPRWYPTAVTLRNGEVLIIGGRREPTPSSAPTPEVYSPATGWRQLPGAASEPAYGMGNTIYPRAWMTPDGRLFVITMWGGTYMVGLEGNGSVVQTSLSLPAADSYNPSVMFAPGKILSVRGGGKAMVVDLSGTTPTAQRTADLSQERLHGNATVLADGRVLMSGGSAAWNLAQQVAYHTEIWDPTTGQWTQGASAAKARLYHSIAILMPDARVLTAGGGAPGPVNQLNAEMYTPPYLYTTDGSGTLAARPVIESAPAVSGWNMTFPVTIDGTSVSRVTLVRTGAVTHTLDFDQRFMDLSFTRQGHVLTVQAPGSSLQAPPGYYMLFVFNEDKVPSVARILRLVDATTAAAPQTPPPAPPPPPPPASPAGATIVVRARATLAANVGPTLSVYVGGVPQGSTEVRTTTFQDFAFPTSAPLPAGSRVDVVYTRDAFINGEDRNLFVESVVINGSNLWPSAPGARYDRGDGNAAFDGIDVVAPTQVMPWNGALRLVTPGVAPVPAPVPAPPSPAPPPPPSPPASPPPTPPTTIVIRARASLAANVGPTLTVWVGGQVAGRTEVRHTGFQDIAFAVAAPVARGTRVDVAYTQDAFINGEDRNLFVEAITLNGTRLLPSAPGVTYDRGAGAAAFDGVDVVAPMPVLPWDGALRFLAP